MHFRPAVIALAAALTCSSLSGLAMAQAEDQNLPNTPAQAETEGDTCAGLNDMDQAQATEKVSDFLAEQQPPAESEDKDTIKGGGGEGDAAAPAASLGAVMTPQDLLTGCKANPDSSLSEMYMKMRTSGAEGVTKNQSNQ